MENKIKRRTLLVVIYALLIVVLFSIYAEVRIFNVWSDNTIPPTYNFQADGYVLEEQVEGDILTREEALDKYVNERIGTITIPSVGMEVEIIQGASNSDADMQLTMKHTVGHEPESYMPGEGHQVVISGHREEQFGALEDVQKGDIIIVDILDDTFLYKVTEMKTVLPSGDDAIEYVRGDTDVDTLVLYTCYPFQPLTPVTHRYVVKAEKIDEVELDAEETKSLLQDEINLEVATDNSDSEEINN